MVPDANDALAFDTWVATVVRQLRLISHQRAKNLGGDKLRVFSMPCNTSGGRASLVESFRSGLGCS